LNVGNTNRPSIRGLGVRGAAWRCFFHPPSFATCLPNANNQDQAFNFTSYLCSIGGCKLILWQRAATVPSRGSILSEAARWHQEQLRVGQRKVKTQNEAECPETRERCPWCFKVEIDTQISTKEK